MATKKNGALSIEEMLRLMAVILPRVDWSLVDPDVVRRAIKDPGHLPLHLTGLLRIGCRLPLQGLKIVPAVYDPELVFGKGAKYLPRYHDKGTDGLKEVDFSQVDFRHCLKDGEDAITGEEKLRRLKAGGEIRYGASVLGGLLKDQSEKGDGRCVLEVMHWVFGLTHMEFLGDVVKVPFFGPQGLGLRRDGNGWWEACSFELKDMMGRDRKTPVYHKPEPG